MRFSKFDFFDRGKKETLLLLPGWACDYRIFGGLDLEYNYLLPVEFSPGNFNGSLLEELGKRKLRKLSLLGWSLGGFCAAGFAGAYPQFADKIFLLGMRKKYTGEGLEEIRKYLKKDRRTYLYSFFRECFFPDSAGFRVFKKDLLKRYLNGMETSFLMEGLDFLAGSELDMKFMKGGNISLIHGEEDRIAPFKDILELKKSLPGLNVKAVKAAGHMLFLNPAFKSVMSEL